MVTTWTSLPGIMQRWTRSFNLFGHLMATREGWAISQLLTLHSFFSAVPESYFYLQPVLCSSANGGSISQWIRMHQNVGEFRSSMRQFTTTASAKKSPVLSEDGALEAVPDRSVLRPPKQAPSVWQIFFTDWLGNKRAFTGGDAKLNVVNEAKAAAKAYSRLSDEERSELKARAKTLKEQYDRNLEAWQKSLTPVDVERENAFRTAQRKSGKSRRKNIADPNAPKKPMSAYFLFLRNIRANPQMTKEIFGDESDPPRQSVLAAAKWRGMSDEEKQSYLTEAATAKLEYEAQRREYELRMHTFSEGQLTEFSLYSLKDIGKFTGKM